MRRTLWLGLGLLVLVSCGKPAPKTAFGGLSDEPWSDGVVALAAQENRPVVILATADW